MNLIPLHDRLILRIVDIEIKTKSGLILSGQEVDENRDVVFGKVLAVGPGKTLDSSGPIPLTCKVGDLVAFNQRIPLRQHYRGQYLYILRENDVLYINNDKDVVEGDFQTIAPVVKETKFLG